MADIKLNTVDCVFTSSDSDNNLILVEHIKETFFDVFECNIQGKTFIFEKIGEEDGIPLVLCDIIKDGKHYVTEALLKIDNESGIFINESLMHGVVEREKIVTTVANPALIEESKLEELSKIKNNTETSAEVNNLIAETLTRYNEGKVQEKMTDYTNIYQSRLDEFESKKKEFLNIIDKEFEDRVKTFNEEIDSKLTDFFKIHDKENKFLVFNETEKLRENMTNLKEEFKVSLNDVKDFNKENILKLIDEKSSEISSTLDTFVNKIIEENKNEIKEKINNLANVFNEKLNHVQDLKQVVTENTNTIQKNNSTKIKKVLEHTNNKFNSLNKRVKLLSEKKNEEYNELLAAVNNKEVVEYKTILKEKIEAAELNSLKEELRNEITNSFQNEMRNMRRYTELTSGGGGSVGQQFHAGGTMDGDLTVTGEISANKIMAATVLSGATLDIGFELSGFNVTGDISANGNITGYSLSSINGFKTPSIEIFEKELLGDNSNWTLTARPMQSLQVIDLVEGSNTPKAEFNSKGITVNGDISATGSLSGGNFHATNTKLGFGIASPITPIQFRPNPSNTSANFYFSETQFESEVPILISSGNLSVNDGNILAESGYVKTSSLTATNITVTNDLSAKGGLSALNGFFNEDVGIGTNKPQRVLHVKDTASPAGIKIEGATNSASEILFSDTDSDAATISYNHNFDKFSFVRSGEVMSLNTEGLTATNITVTDLSAGDIIKGKRLNIGAGNLFVDDGSSTGSAFVKIGAYGSGNFFGKEGSVNGAAFSLGVGTAGKIVEDMSIATFAISGAGLVNKNSNPVVLIASPGANKYNVPVSIQVYKSQSGGTRVSWGGGQAAISIGTFASSDTSGTFSQLTSLPRTTAIISGDWLYNRNQGPDTTTRVHSNRALAFRTSSNIASNSSADVYYLKIRYMVMSEDGDFKSIGNLQIKDS